MRKGLKRFVAVVCMAAIIGSSLTGGITRESEKGSLYEVSAASKTTGTKNLTKSIKVETSSGKKMTKKQAGKLSAASFKLAGRVIDSEQSDENILISPTSILFAFGMAENGAKGNTRTQLEKAVNGGVKVSSLNNALAFSRKQMMSSEDVEWNVANSVWFLNRKDVKVKKAFLKKVKTYYGAEIYKAPFNNATVKDMNAWVKKNTNKMIPKIINQIDDSAVMYLINAIAFEGKWEDEFKDNQVLKNQEFTNVDGTKVEITMLTCGMSSYFKLNGGYGFRKDYAGGEYSFVGIEMPEGMTPAEYMKKLSANGSDFVSAMDSMKYGNVTVKFPEFTTDYDVDLTSTLIGMGASDAFDRNRANLYNMFQKDKNSNYYFSQVLHKTHIEVDRSGTKAAAATSIAVSKVTSVGPSSDKIQIFLDRPFVYAIVDNNTKLPVFIGVVNKLEK